MEEDERRFFTVGELAHKAGITVRTLQYYDKCRLLIPEHGSGGRRLYNQHDIIRLQQILFLRSFGFSLEEIRDRLLPAESAAELEKILTRQYEVLQAQIAHLHEVTDMIKKTIVELKAGGEIGSDKFTAIMELMRQGNPYAFILRYFGNDQIKHLQTRFKNPEQTADFMRHSEELFTRMMTLYRQGADPAGAEGQKLVAQWWQMVLTFTAGDKDLLKTLITAGTDVDNWPGDVGEFKHATKMFLEKAFTEFFRKNDIRL